MTAFLFSGQGSQYPGMGKELLEANPEFNNIYEAASDILGFDLKKLCFEADEKELAKTCNSQPAIMATSLLCHEAAKKHGITATAVAGHSLGEYAAMTVSGMLSLEDSFKVIKARAAAMDKAAENSDGVMYAILKLTPEEIEKICNETNGYVVPVNYNSPAQTVIAGEREPVEKAVFALQTAGAKAVQLNVASAFHSKLMLGAADEFYNKIKSINFNKPNVKFFSNVTGNELTDFLDMPSLLAKHMISPVKFISELASMQAQGYDTFIELGPNKVLTGLVKKTLKDVTALNIENDKTLKAAIIKK